MRADEKEVERLLEVYREADVNSVHPQDGIRAVVAEIRLPVVSEQTGSNLVAQEPEQPQGARHGIFKNRSTPERAAFWDHVEAISQQMNEHTSELAALRKNAGDYKEALAEIERLRGALKEARRKAWQDDFRPIINAIGEISVQEAMDAIERTL